MARANDIQYVQFYATGSAARQLDIPQKRKTKEKPKTAAVKRSLPVIAVDPLALAGTLVALVMLVCMIVGFIQVNTANAQIQILQAQVNQLEAENEYLQRQYDGSIDLEEVRRAAESMGLVPMDQVERIMISAPEPVLPEEATWWEDFIEDLTALFA